MPNFAAFNLRTAGRVLVGLLLLVFTFSPIPGVREKMQELLVEAYIGVSVFIILTLSIVSFFENLFGFNLGHVSQTKPQLQILLASLLGGLPGCGGAIMVVTYYLRGQMSFGAVVATLTATMGDAAFLLLSKKPLVGLAVMGTAFCAAIITGYLVSFIHGEKYNLPLTSSPETLNHATHGLVNKQPAFVSPLRKLWWFLAIPGVILGIINVMFIEGEISVLVQNLTYYIGIAGALFTLSLWVIETHDHSKPEHTCHRGKCAFKVIESDTSFITFWVVTSFVLYNLIITIFGLDLTTLVLRSAKYFLPLVAVLIGFIPGCGPQIIVTSLYIQGVIPFSSQIGNAISTDGDALFPALVMAPKASFVATMYSAIPAVVLAYGYLLLFE